MRDCSRYWLPELPLEGPPSLPQSLIGGALDDKEEAARSRRRVTVVVTIKTPRLCPRSGTNRGVMSSRDKKPSDVMPRGSTADAAAGAKPSWADVVAASNEEAEPAMEPVATRSVSANAEATPEPEQPPIAPGDIVRHAKFGDCSVHRISEKPRFLHMAKPNEKVRKLSLDIVEFVFQGIEGRRRIFTPRIKK